MAWTSDGTADRNEPEERSYSEYSDRAGLRAQKAARRAAMIASMVLRATPGSWPARGPDPSLSRS